MSWSKRPKEREREERRERERKRRDNATPSLTSSNAAEHAAEGKDGDGEIPVGVVAEIADVGVHLVLAAALEGAADRTGRLVDHTRVVPKLEEDTPWSRGGWAGGVCVVLS